MVLSRHTLRFSHFVLRCSLSSAARRSGASPQACRSEDRQRTPGAACRPRSAPPFAAGELRTGVPRPRLERSVGAIGGRGWGGRSWRNA